MANITVKNIPDETYESLKRVAAEQRRSIDSEVLYLIEQATASIKIDPQQHLLRAGVLREKTKGYEIGETELRQIKNEGRP